MSQCQYRIGFLSLQSCGETAVAQCGFCSQPVCGRHLRTVEMTNACLSCYVGKAPANDNQAEQQQANPQETDDLEHERIRRDSYSRHHYHSSYGSSSYRSFDDRYDGDAGPARSALAASDFQDS